MHYEKQPADSRMKQLPWPYLGPVCRNLDSAFACLHPVWSHQLAADGSSTTWSAVATALGGSKRVNQDISALQEHMCLLGSHIQIYNAPCITQILINAQALYNRICIRSHCSLTPFSSNVMQRILPYCLPKPCNSVGMNTSRECSCAGYSLSTQDMVLRVLCRQWHTVAVPLMTLQGCCLAKVLHEEQHF